MPFSERWRPQRPDRGCPACTSPLDFRTGCLFVQRVERSSAARVLTAKFLVCVIDGPAAWFYFNNKAMQSAAVIEGSSKIELVGHCLLRAFLYSAASAALRLAHTVTKC